MRVLLDENLPRLLSGLLAAHEVMTVQEMNWAGVQNGELVRLAESAFDVLVTADKNLRYQQNLAHRRIAIVELPTNRWPVLKAMGAEVREAVAGIDVGSAAYIVVHNAPR
jgi:PIN like domain